MHAIRLTVAAALAAAVMLPSSVQAQPPGAAPPPPPPYQPPPHWGSAPRQGLTLGAGFGIGDMSPANGYCSGCDYNPGALGLDAHIGGMLSPSFAVLLEYWGTLQAVDAGDTEFLYQSMAMIAAQLWVSQRLWIKGGLGFAHLSRTYSDDYLTVERWSDDGGAMMGAIGFELISSSRFALDLQGRVGVGAYDDFVRGEITTGLVSLGVNWY